MTLHITYNDQVVAAATADRFFLANELETLPAGDPTLRFVTYMCAYAMSVASGDLPGPYSDEQARRFAWAALIPDELLEREDLDVDHVSTALRVPPAEFTAARASLVSQSAINHHQ